MTHQKGNFSNQNKRHILSMEFFFVCFFLYVHDKISCPVLSFFLAHSQITFFSSVIVMSAPWFVGIKSNAPTPHNWKFAEISMLIEFEFVFPQFARSQRVVRSPRVWFLSARERDQWRTLSWWRPWRKQRQRGQWRLWWPLDLFPSMGRLVFAIKWLV